MQLSDRGLCSANIADEWAHTDQRSTEGALGWLDNLALILAQALLRGVHRCI